MNIVVNSIRVNVNVNVKFKPTALGLSYIERFEKEAKFNNKITVLPDGYYVTTLWECMNIFGDIERSGGGLGLFVNGDLIIVPDNSDYRQAALNLTME